MAILYLVHDLTDAAVAKRVAMLRDGGAVVTVAGFCRERPPQEVGGCPAVFLGRTYNSRFTQRIFAVLRQIITAQRSLFAGAEVILARNLEMLAIAVRGRSLAESDAPIIYECLDIHRLLLASGPAGIALRATESWLLGRTAALITSSPAFIRHYFAGRTTLPIRLVENKIYPTPPSVNRTVLSPGPPWKIGWFGMLRCKKSLQLLSNLAKNNQKVVEVILRGRPSYDQIPDFDRVVAETPGLQFLGRYRNPEDLQAIYGEVHFNWTIDMFEEGLNSTWLLPNRLYEGGFYGVVPVAADGLETSRFLSEHNFGVILTEPKDQALAGFFDDLSPSAYQKLAEAAQKSEQIWTFSPKDCMELVNYLYSFGKNKVR